LLESLMIA